MSTVEKIHFRYESPANIVRLLITIMFEQRYSDRDISVYHARFDNESDDIYQMFMETLFPSGRTIGEEEINMLTKYAYNFMQKDDATLDLYVKYDMRTTYSYVYAKYDKRLYPANMGEHFNIVMRLCAIFFKDFDANDITSQKIEAFIRNNIEIKSDFTSIDIVCRQGNIELIKNEILYNKEYDLF